VTNSPPPLAWNDFVPLITRSWLSRETQISTSVDGFPVPSDDREGARGEKLRWTTKSRRTCHKLKPVVVRCARAIVDPEIGFRLSLIGTHVLRAREFNENDYLARLLLSKSNSQSARGQETSSLDSFRATNSSPNCA